MFQRLTIIIGAILIITLGSCGSNQPATGDQENVFDRVTQTKTLRASFISYPPSMIVDPNTGGKSGIMHEIIERVARNLSLELQYVEEAQWASMVQSVNADRVDIVVSGIWPSSARALVADFTSPVYYSPVYAYVRANDNSFDGDLISANDGDVRIATLDGELSSIIAATEFPDAQTVSLPQGQDVSQLILMITTNKADITFVESAVAKAYLEKNPGTIRRVADTHPVRVFPNTFLVKKGEEELISALNIAILELNNSRFTARVLEKYDASGNQFLEVALPYTVD